MSWHLSWEHTEGSDGHFPTCRPEIRETVDLPDLHRIWLLYYTHVTRHTLSPSFFGLTPCCVLPVQTCEDTTCPFSGMVSLQFQTEVCPTVFGISQHSLPRRIAFTNTYYGGDSPHTLRVLYINGEIPSKHHINHRDQGHYLFSYNNRWNWSVEGAFSYPEQRWRRWRPGRFHPRHCPLRWYDEQKSYRPQFTQDSQSGKIYLLQLLTS